jgi:hypothetical protein
MYREDRIYASEMFDSWSMSKDGPLDKTGAKKEGFERFSERFLRLYPGYMLDKNMNIRAAPDTAVINMRELVTLFKSRDEGLWERTRWLF